MTHYTHTPQMGQISGLGGKYEDECQYMLDAGVKWLLSNKGSVMFPPLDGIGRIFYITNESSSSISSLECLFNEVLDERSFDVSGINPPTLVQMLAVTNRLMYIHRYGWDQYVDHCEMMHNCDPTTFRRDDLWSSLAELERDGDSYSGVYFQQSFKRPEFNSILDMGFDGVLMWTPGLGLWKTSFRDAFDTRSVYPVWTARVSGVVWDKTVFPNETVVEQITETRWASA